MDFRTHSQHGDPLESTADIVAAYLSRNAVTASSVPDLIASVYASITGLETPAAAKARPAVPLRRSVTPSYLICLECSERLQTLTRHLKARHHLSPDQYRAKWNLPASYPMSAANFSAKRAAIARGTGLGSEYGKGR